VFFGPQRKRNGSQVIHQWYRVSVLGKVDGSQIKFTGLASLHPDVRKLLRDIYRELTFRFFSASRTKNPPKLPLLQAERTQQESFATVTFRPKHA
jgi:hypothetical protein